ncbi:MAG: NAD(P)/FAD-dependent oxidoreductase [bacterium]
MSLKPSGFNPEDPYDITFIGGGPVGLYGMYYAGLRLMKSKVIDMLGELGGGLMALYPEKYIFDVAGFPKVMAKSLVAQMKEQALQYPHTICLEERVESLQQSDDGSIVLKTNRGSHLSRTVVVCAGLGAYIPRSLEVPNLARLEGRGVYYSVREPEAFRDKEVLIVGGGNAAIDYALLLEKIAKAVTLIHRNEFFAAHEDTVGKVKNSSVRMLYPFWELKGLTGDDRVENATIVQSRTGREEHLPVDAVVLNIGFLTNLGPIADWGLLLEKNAIVVDSRMRTNIEGVYAAGDIVTYDGKLKLISSGCGEVAVAVNNAKNYIDPRAKVSPGHSTDKHVLAQKKLAQGRAEKKARKAD